jgi:hypothetical protein
MHECQAGFLLDIKTQRDFIFIPKVELDFLRKLTQNCQNTENYRNFLHF